MNQHDAADLIDTGLAGLDVDVIAELPIAEALNVWHRLEEANRVLGQVRAQLPNLLAASFGEKTLEIPGLGVFELHGKKNRTAWDKEALLSAVLDSRQVDEVTGEVADESPLDKVLAVWNLAAPRTGVLKKRKIDPDEFCRSEWAGYAIQRVG